MNILIMGGTGAMGKPLVEILSRNSKNKLLITSRKKQQTRLKNVDYIMLNARNKDEISSLVTSNNFDCIIDFMSYKYIDFFERYELYLKNTKQYIFFSSARVYAEKDGYINEKNERLLDVTEDIIFKSKAEYSLEKAKEENLLLNSKYKNYTIIRPYITYNYNRMQLGVYEKEDWLYRAINGKKILIQSELLDKKTTMTYGYDVAAYISKLINNPKAFGEIFNISEDKMDITWRQIFAIYKNILKKYNIDLKCVETHEIIFKRKYQLIYDRYFNRSFDCSKIKKVSNYRINSSLEKNLEECISIFMKSKTFLDIDYSLQAYMDKRTHDRPKFKTINGTKNKIKYCIYRYLPNCFLKLYDIIK